MVKTYIVKKGQKPTEGKSEQSRKRKSIQLHLIRIVKSFLQRCRKHSTVLSSRETEEYMKKGHDINLYFRHHCMMPKKIDKFHNCDNMRV